MPLNSKGDCAKCKRAGREQNPEMCSDCGQGYCPHCDGGCSTPDCSVEPRLCERCGVAEGVNTPCIGRIGVHSFPTSVEAKSDTNLIQLAPSEPRTAAAEIPGYGDFMKALGQELVPVAPAEPPQQDEPGYESERLQQEKERPRFSKPVAAEPRPNRVGIIVHCARCGYMKKPIGRSGPLGAVYCDEDCAGYRQPPFVGSLWPGETSEDFGYPVGTDGTEAK